MIIEIWPIRVWQIYTNVDYLVKEAEGERKEGNWMCGYTEGEKVKIILLALFTEYQKSLDNLILKTWLLLDYPFKRMA